MMFNTGDKVFYTAEGVRYFGTVVSNEEANAHGHDTKDKDKIWCHWPHLRSRGIAWMHVESLTLFEAAQREYSPTQVGDRDDDV